MRLLLSVCLLLAPCAGTAAAGFAADVVAAPVEGQKQDPDVVPLHDEPVFLDDEGALEQRVTALEEELRRLREEDRATGAEASPSPDQNPNRSGYWIDFDPGFVVRHSERRRFWFRIGGQFAQDWSFFSEDRRVERAFGNFQDGTDFRTARFSVSGFFPSGPDGSQVDDSQETSPSLPSGVRRRGFAFRLEYDFTDSLIDPDVTDNQDGSLRDAYVEIRGLPGGGNFRLGHFIEPFGLEAVTLSKYATFVERGLTSILTPGRNAGIQWQRNSADRTRSFAIGYFRQTGPRGRGVDDGEGAVTGRATWAPYYENNGKQVIHVGASYRFQRPPGSRRRFAGTPEVAQAPVVVDTRIIDQIDQIHQAGLEGALIFGPLSLQGEWVVSQLERSHARDVTLSAGYVALSYFLTGENRRYQNGRFGRIYPKTSVFELGTGPRREDRTLGWGAWEVATRWSMVDLDDGLVSGGDIDHNITVGLNGYLNRNTRVFFDYVNSQLDTGVAHAFVFRTQFEF